MDLGEEDFLHVVHGSRGWKVQVEVGVVGPLQLSPSLSGGRLHIPPASADALDGKISPSVTQDISLLGAEGYRAAWNKRAKIARAFGVHKVRIEHLLNRYGVLTDELLDLIRDRPELGNPLPGADDYIEAEVVYAATHEGALHLEDVLARRTRISIEAWDRGVSAAPVAARLMADALGWSREQEEREVTTYLKRVAAERASQSQPDDESADRVRLEAPDIMPTR